MISFLDVKQSTISRIAGVCVDSPEFAAIVNEATRKLMRRGDWVGTVSPIQICTRRGCLVLPRYIQSIRKLSLCNYPLPVGNLWYRFLSHGECGSGHFSSMGHDGGMSVLHANGQACCYSDIYGDGRLLRAYPTVLEDIGKTLTIFGVDNYNQPLRTDNGDGTWSDGWVITLNTPYGSPDASASPAPVPYVRRIDRVVKEKTQGQVRLFAYNPTTDTLEDLAVYDPSETSPTYTRYSLHAHHSHSTGTCTTSTCACDQIHSIIALVKLRFIAVEFDTDWVMVDNLDMLKDMIQSIKLREAGDLQGSTAFELAAVREGNREIEDNFPDDTFSAENNIFGPGVSFSNHAF